MRRFIPFIILSGLLLAQDSCDGDEDGDGWSIGDGDCDDQAPEIYPGATERCNGLDDDCDGADDTLGYWAFDEGVGTIATDAGPYNLNGIINNPSWSSEGYVGGALDFNGVDTYVTLDYDELAPETGISVSAWVQPDSLKTSSWDSIVTRGASGSSDLDCCEDSYYLGYYGQQMSWYTQSGEDEPPLLDGANYASHIGGWHHILSTWDVESGTRAIYVDGVLTAEDVLGPDLPFYDGTPTRIGADTNNGSFILPFDGRIDEVKIFNCALSAEQVYQDYATNWPY